MKALRILTPFLTLLLFAGIPPIRAQDRELPAPKPPYIAPLPHDGHWLITLKRAEPDPAQSISDKRARTVTPEPIPTAIDTLKTGDTKRITLTFRDGTAQQIHQVRGYILTTAAEGPQISTATPGAPPYPFYTTAFLFVENIGPSTFKGVASIQGKECFYYRTGTTEAWIDIDSMLPIASKAEGIIAHFQFLPPPTTPIALPPEEASILNQQERAHTAASLMR